MKIRNKNLIYYAFLFDREILTIHVFVRCESGLCVQNTCSVTTTSVFRLYHVKSVWTMISVYSDKLPASILRIISVAMCTVEDALQKLTFTVYCDDLICTYLIINVRF